MRAGRLGFWHVFAPLLFAAAVILVTLVFADGEALEQRVPPTDSRSTFQKTATVADALPDLIRFPPKSGEQYGPKLRFFVGSQEGIPAVAATFYTGYPFRAKLLGFSSGAPFR